MKRSFKLFSKFCFRPASIQSSNKGWINLLKATLLVSGIHHYQSYQTNYARCSIFQSTPKFNYYSAAKSTIVIYRHNQDLPIASGIIFDESGLCVSISNIYPKISEDRLDMGNFYAKVLGDDKTYSLSFLEYIENDNIVLFKLMKKDPDLKFHPAKFASETLIGKDSYVIGKSKYDYNLMESGLINEVNFNSKLAFGKENDTSSFNIMSNIPNKYPTLYGGPLFDEGGHVLGMIIPFEEKLLSDHTIAMPASFMEGIITQYKETGRVRRPYLGMSLKSSASGSGASVIKLNSDGPASQNGVRLGDTVVEINDQKITNNNDFFKCLGYQIGNTFKLKLEKDGKFRVVHVVSS